MTTRTITVEALRIAMNAMGYQHNVEEVFAALPAEPAGAGLREALAEQWLRDNDLYAVTHLHPAPADCAECNAAALAATPVGEEAG